MKSFYKDYAVLQLLQLRTESSIAAVARLVSGVRVDFIIRSSFTKLQNKLFKASLWSIWQHNLSNRDVHNCLPRWSFAKCLKHALICMVRPRCLIAILAPSALQKKFGPHLKPQSKTSSRHITAHHGIRRTE
jgi:hypothetical protein